MHRQEYTKVDHLFNSQVKSQRAPPSCMIIGNSNSENNLLKIVDLTQ